MEKKHSNPYLEHIGSQQKLFEPMIPTRPIRDVNNHSKSYLHRRNQRTHPRSAESEKSVNPYGLS